MKRWVYIVISFLFVNFFLLSQQLWQGNAAIIRKGALEQAGLFAASNSFAINTKILVENINNGKTTTVTVIKRIEEKTNMFLLISEEAANELGMNYYDVIGVKVKVIAVNYGDLIGLPDDLPYNPDPDILSFFPPDEVFYTPTPTPGRTPGLTPSQTPVWQPTPAVTPASTPAATPVITPLQTPVLTPTLQITLTPTPTLFPVVTPTPSPTPATVITQTPSPAPTPAPEDLAARSPQKNLFLPPREDSKFVLNDYNKPGIKEQTQPRLALKEAELKPTPKPVLEAVNTPGKKEQTRTVSLKDLPAIENPVPGTEFNLAQKEEAQDSNNSLEEPKVVKKDIPIPDPAVQIPELEKESILVYIPDTPILADNAPDAATEKPYMTEKRIVLTPVEPKAPDKAGGTPDLGYEIPYLEKAELAYGKDAVNEPEIARIEATGESLSRTDKELLAFNPTEPQLPDQKKLDRPEPAGEAPFIKEKELAAVAAEPIPPEKHNILKPELTTMIPDLVVSEFEYKAEEPELPATKEKTKPEPTTTVPKVAKATIEERPDKLNVPEITDKTDKVLNKENVEVVLKPTDFKPPTGDKKPETIKVTPIVKTSGDVQDINKLEEKSYFIQLGAYKDQTVALGVEKKYANVYPIGTYAPVTKNGIYKVLLGPLNKDESDTLLFRFRSLGFKDAFVKYIN